MNGTTATVYIHLPAIGMIEVKVMDWYGKQRMAALYRDPYILHVVPGKDDKEALKNMSKELRRLAKECDERSKSITDNKKSS